MMRADVLRDYLTACVPTWQADLQRGAAQLMVHNCRGWDPVGQQLFTAGTAFAGADFIVNKKDQPFLRRVTISSGPEWPYVVRPPDNFGWGVLGCVLLADDIQGSDALVVHKSIGGRLKMVADYWWSQGQPGIRFSIGDSGRIRAFLRNPTADK